MIGLGRGLDLPVVAEGVETDEQLAFLAREACDEVQGYLIGRPGPDRELCRDGRAQGKAGAQAGGRVTAVGSRLRRAGRH